LKSTLLGRGRFTKGFNEEKCHAVHYVAVRLFASCPTAACLKWPESSAEARQTHWELQIAFRHTLSLSNDQSNLAIMRTSSSPIELSSISPASGSLWTGVYEIRF
jgi:hypothetical protein